MKPLAIHHLSTGFTQRWIEFCEENSIPHIKVNCYDSNIVSQLTKCSALLWHWDYENYKDRQFALSLILSAEKMGLKTLPNYNSCWHFDDKIAQKYLMESLDIPLIKTEVFYDKLSVREWIKNIKYPIVFKLKTGAGSQNVKLIKTEKEVTKIVRKAFRSGFEPKNSLNIIKDRYNNFFKLKSKKSFFELGKSIYRYFIPKYYLRFIPKEKGYIYFQEFLPENKFDTRLIIIGNRCFGIRRYNRENDFRASGSGLLEYEPENFNLRAVKIAFEVVKKLKTNTLALDFLFDSNKKPKIAEISYAFPTGLFTDNCLGYWDDNLNWIPGQFNVQHLMVEDLVAEINSM